MEMGRGTVRVAHKHGPGVGRIVVNLAFAATSLLISAVAPAQNVDAPSPQVPSQIKERFLVSHFPDKPSVPPSFTIPIDALGFSAPGAIYLGARNALVSLDFLDENHLLLTFRVPSLLHRTNGNETDEREIRAVVLALPKGTIESEASWTVHDRERYLWMLSNGHFLVRDRNSLLQSDSSLALKPYLDFPGSLLWLELDPSQQLLVTNSREPVATQKQGQGSGASAANHSVSDASAADAGDASAPDAGSQPSDVVVRILHRNSGQVMLVSRVHATVHLAINSLGYLENLRGRGSQWTLDLSYFTGGTRMIGNVDSACEPRDDFLSENEFLLTACGDQGGSKLIAMSTDGRTLWIAGAPSTEVWPQLTVAANGSRLAWTTLDASQPVNSYAPMNADDVKEQSVTVFNAENGDIVLVSPLSPILDVGGNVAISPSGRRVALIGSGGIQVFDLPAAPSLPAAVSHP
jgi:hypothetical protein